MEIKPSLYKLFFFLVMFMYVFSCQYSQNKNEISSNKKQNISNKMKKTEAEWKSSLTDQEYRILREKGTERAFTGKYDGHFEEGVYNCAGCGTQLFESETKYLSLIHI